MPTRDHIVRPAQRRDGGIPAPRHVLLVAVPAGGDERAPRRRRVFGPVAG